MFKLFKKIISIFSNKKNNKNFVSITNDGKELPEILKDFLSNKSIYEVSVPRAQIDFIQEGELLEDIIKYIIKTGRSRFPVIKNHFEVSGILYVKDIFKCIDDLSSTKVKDIMHPAIKISYTSRIKDVLHGMMEQKKHMAIILDEYGDIDGIVTIEDIVEELLGEIEDEFDNAKQNYNLIADGAIINADMSLEEFNKVFSFNFDEEVDTIGGYLCFLAGKIPSKNERIVKDGLEVIVLEATKKHLKKIKLLKKIESKD